MIKQPAGIAFKTKDGGVIFEYDSTFSERYNASFKRKQFFIDNECLRLMRPYTPMKSGTLINSATLHTRVGSGLIIQKTPYARRQYYNQYANYSNNSTGLRGSHWFERMKVANKKAILEGARKI